MTNGLEQYKEYMKNSLGGKRVCVSFNPSQQEDVATIKEKTAEVINMLGGKNISKATAFTNFEKEEVVRLYSLAKTSYEEACMWAIKAFAKHQRLIENQIKTKEEFKKEIKTKEEFKKEIKTKEEFKKVFIDCSIIVENLEQKKKIILMKLASLGYTIKDTSEICDLIDLKGFIYASFANENTICGIEKGKRYDFKEDNGHLRGISIDDFLKDIL